MTPAGSAPSAEAQLWLSSDDARSFATAVLERAGFSAEHAALGADCLVESSLRGIDSHGVISLLPVFVSGQRPSGPPELVIRTAATAVLDGRDAFGLETARLAVSIACDLAGTSGIGAVAVRNIGYVGAIWWSLEPALDRNLMAVGATNSVPCVAPHGGLAPLHGTNPIAAAVPGAGVDPIVLDMRTNALRMADYREAVRNGGPLPDGTVLDRDGNPHTALPLPADSAYLPLAGAKGYGLALLVDVLTAGLGGGAIGQEVDQAGIANDLSAFFLVVDPDAFGSRAVFEASVGRLVRQAHSIAPIDPDEPVRVPGERAARQRRLRLASGIPVHLSEWEEMEQALADFGVLVHRPELHTRGPASSSSP